jgi:hypothetical protein
VIGLERLHPRLGQPAVDGELEPCHERRQALGQRPELVAELQRRPSALHVEESAVLERRRVRHGDDRRSNELVRELRPRGDAIDHLRIVRREVGNDPLQRGDGVEHLPGHGSDGCVVHDEILLGCQLREREKS